MEHALKNNDVDIITNVVFGNWINPNAMPGDPAYASLNRYLKNKNGFYIKNEGKLKEAVNIIIKKFNPLFQEPYSKCTLCDFIEKLSDTFPDKNMNFADIVSDLMGFGARQSGGSVIAVVMTSVDINSKLHYMPTFLEAGWDPWFKVRKDPLGPNSHNRWLYASNVFALYNNSRPFDGAPIRIMQKFKSFDSEELEVIHFGNNDREYSYEDKENTLKKLLEFLLKVTNGSLKDNLERLL